MNSAAKSGRIRLVFDGQSYSAEWRVVGPRVEISSELGEASSFLGGLASAPATVAAEALRELARKARRPSKPVVDRARFNVKDARG